MAEFKLGLRTPSPDWTLEDRAAAVFLLNLRIQGFASIAVSLDSNDIIYETRKINLILSNPAEWLEEQRNDLLEGLAFTE